MPYIVTREPSEVARLAGDFYSSNEVKFAKEAQ
jgi:hypothetical protein